MSEPMTTCIDLTPVRVDGRSFCGCYHSEDDTPMDYVLSGNYGDAIEAVQHWWGVALSTAGSDGAKNHRDDIEKFLQRLAQLTDAELEIGAGQSVFISLGRTGCGCYCGTVKECVEAVLSREVANVMKRQEDGADPVPAARPFYLPAAFAGDPNQIMYVSDKIVIIAKWDGYHGFVVEKVVWSKEGASTLLGVTMEYLKDMADSHLDGDTYTSPSARAAVIARFCELLFQSVGLPVDCIAAEVPPTTISAEAISAAAKKVPLQFDDPIDLSAIEIVDGKVKVSFPDEEAPFYVF